MAANSLHLFLTLLAFSLLISLPTSKASRLLVHDHNEAIISPEDAIEMNKEETMKMVDDELFYRRMNFEINRDYPGSGANNHHTPNPPVKE